jgi:hypothetical protein
MKENDPAEILKDLCKKIDHIHHTDVFYCNMKNNEFYQHIGVTTTTMWHMKNANHSTALFTLIAIANGLGLKLSITFIDEDGNHDTFLVSDHADLAHMFVSLRKKFDMSQREFTKCTKMTSISRYEIEDGVETPRTDVLARMADKLGLRLHIDLV